MFGGQGRHSKGSGVNRLDISFDQQLRQVGVVEEEVEEEEKEDAGRKEQRVAGNRIKCLIECFVQKGEKFKLTISDVVGAPDECHKRDWREIAFLSFWVFF